MQEHPNDDAMSMITARVTPANQGDHHEKSITSTSQKSFKAESQIL